VDMDISMDIHGKSVDMDMDGKFHIHGKAGSNDHRRNTGGSARATHATIFSAVMRFMLYAASCLQYLFKSLRTVTKYSQLGLPAVFTSF